MLAQCTPVCFLSWEVYFQDCSTNANTGFVCSETYASNVPLFLREILKPKAFLMRFENLSLSVGRLILNLVSICLILL